MDINIFLINNKSNLPSRIDLLNNIHQKAESISEEDGAKIMPILSMSKFYNPILMAFLSIPFAIFAAVILLVILGFADDFIIKNIFGTKWLNGNFGVFLFFFIIAYSVWMYYKNTKAYNYNTLMEILNGLMPDNSFFKAYFSIVFHSDKADADKLEEQNQIKEQK